MKQILTMDDVRTDHRFHVGFIWQCEHCQEFWKEATQIGEIMHTGMLWFDNSKTTLEVKIKKASEYYEKKYGRKPNLVLVHPSMLIGNTHLSITMNIRPYRPVLPGHIWVGLEDKS